MLHFCHADLFGIFLCTPVFFVKTTLRFPTFILRSATENGSRKDSRQAGMTILKGYVNLINTFVLIGKSVRIIL